MGKVIKNTDNNVKNIYKINNRYISPYEKKSIKVFTFFLALLCLLFLIIFKTNHYQPSKEVKQLIMINSEKYKLQPEFLQAVIAVEIKYNERAVSHIGAIGVMQLVPETAKWISEESGIPCGDLKKPEINIPLGAWYLRYLLDKYDGNLELALAAYNAGRGNVDEWIETKQWPRDFNDIQQIPFPETREFVKLVIQTKEELKEEIREDLNNSD